MPNMNDRDLLGWKTEIRLAENSLEKFRKMCMENRKAFFAPNDPTEPAFGNLANSDPNSWSEPALVTRFLQTKLANLYLQEPEFTLNPEQALYASVDGNVRDGEEMARTFGAGVNHFYKVTDQAVEDTDVIADCILMGLGFKLHGYHTSFVFSPKLDEQQWSFGYAIGETGHYHAVSFDPNGRGKTTLDKGHSHRVVGSQIQPERAEGQRKEHDHVFSPVASAAERSLIISLFESLNFTDAPWEYDQFIQRQSPWAKRMSPIRAIPDPRGRRESEWSYFAYDEYRQLKDVQNFPLFKNTDGLESKEFFKGGGYEPNDIDDIETTDKPRFGDTVKGEEETETEYLRYVKLYYVFIKRDIVNAGKSERNDKILVFVKGHPKPLYYDDNPYAFDGYPISIMKWLPSPSSFVTISDVSMWRDVFQDYLHFRRIILRQIDRMKRIYAVLESPLEGKQNMAAKITSAVDGEAVSLPGPLDDIRKVVQVLDDPPINPNLWQIKAELRQDIREIAGVNENTSGGPLSSRRTATEIMNFEQSRKQLLGIEQAAVMRYLKRSGEIFLSLLQQFYTGSTMVPILTGNGQQQMVPFTREEARTRCRLDVVPESMVPMDRQFRRWELTNLMQMIAQNPMLAQMIPPEGWVAFMKQMLDTYRVPLIGKIMPPNPAMMQGQQGGQGGGGASPMPGIEGILGNITGQGQGEGGPIAGNVEPFRQGIETRAPTPGHISGMMTRR
jgi:hypothetical protein